MKKIVIINASPRRKNNTSSLLGEVKRGIEDAGGLRIGQEKGTSEFIKSRQSLFGCLSLSLSINSLLLRSK